MTLEEQRKKLSECKDLEDTYDLYKEVFGTIVPENPENKDFLKDLEDAEEAIYTNKKMDPVTFKRGLLIR
tara:strand:- start:48 stop:257 length:210 start_codon:yes stop_codon:yes gene_type:complete